MQENRRQILEMLAEGKITAAEAERLLSAVENTPAAGDAPVPATHAPRYLRVLVEAAEPGDSDENTTTKVNIRVPLRLLRAGVKLANLIPPVARQHVNEALRDQGIGFDINQLKPEDLDELVTQLNDLTIDVDKPGKDKVKVRVFCE